MSDESLMRCCVAPLSTIAVIVLVGVLMCSCDERGVDACRCIRCDAAVGGVRIRALTPSCIENAISDDPDDDADSARCPRCRFRNPHSAVVWLSMLQCVQAYALALGFGGPADVDD